MHGSGPECILRVPHPRSGARLDAISQAQPVQIRQVPLSGAELGSVRGRAPDAWSAHSLALRRAPGDQAGSGHWEAWRAAHRPGPGHRGCRVWRNLHLAVNADTGKVLASDRTNQRTADCVRVPGLLDQIDDEVPSLTADGVYDAGAVSEAAQG
ncbi:MAG: transposase [Gemmatimonadota bacterium]